MEFSGPIRAYQDLSRAFFKVLDELRKQQEWSLKIRPLSLRTIVQNGQILIWKLAQLDRS
jgi:hypothetical protein